MATLRLYNPVKPVHINQPFGANPTYYAKFHDSNGNPLRGHDGIDFIASHGTPVYAAHDGLIHYEKDSHGGEGMAIHTTIQFGFGSGTAYFVSMYWHLIGDTDPKYPSPIALNGMSFPVKAGDLIGYANNTGAPYESSGDHLHFGLFPVDGKENTLNVGNGFNGRVDPEPYFCGIYAEDISKLTIFTRALVVALTKIRDYYLNKNK